MQPTMELRFVEREIEVNPKPNQFLVAVDMTGKPFEQKPYTVTVRVLQQKWIELPHYDYLSKQPPAMEWRDVPLVKEEA